MKRLVLSALLCLALLLTCTAPTFAYRLDSDGFTIHPNEETYQFGETHKQALDKQGIYAVSADNWNFCAEFHDGLLLIHEAVTTLPDNAGYNDNYVDKNGKLVDLNRNRYTWMFSFSGGYAAALGGGTIWGAFALKPTYIDTKGNEIVSPSDEWRAFQVDKTLYLGRFENGRALVVRAPKGGGSSNTVVEYDYGAGKYEWSNWSGFEYAYIDTKGKVVSAWTMVKDARTAISLPLYDKTGVWIGHRMNEDAWGKEVTNPPVQPASEPPKAYQRPDLPDYADADTYFQSKGKITNIFLGDLDFGAFTLTVTNSTNHRDSGVIAVAAANIDRSTGGENSSGVFFIPYVLEPNSSGEYFINHRNMIHQKMFNDDSRKTGLNAEALNGQVAARVIHFQDDDDLWSFYDIVPYEQNWQPRNLVNDFQPVCNGAAGQVFLKQLGIARPAGTGGSHSFCTPE